MLLIIQTLLIYWQEIVLRLFREAIQELYPKHKLHLDGKIALQIKVGEYYRDIELISAQELKEKFEQNGGNHD